MSFLLPNYVQLVNHSSTTLAALMLLPGAIIGAGFAPFSGLILIVGAANRFSLELL